MSESRRSRRLAGLPADPTPIYTVTSSEPNKEIYYENTTVPEVTAKDDDDSVAEACVWSFVAVFTTVYLLKSMALF